MKTYTVKEPTYKSIRGKDKEVTMYETDDGQIFKKENDAIAHEKKLEYFKKLDVIKKIDVDNDIFDFSYENWYYASNEEELELIISHFGGLKQSYCDTYINGWNAKQGGLNVGDWITARHDDMGDYRSKKCFYTLEWVKQEIQKFLSAFNDQ